jgi:transitional endoplasmic reticulum ATPase
MDTHAQKSVIPSPPSSPVSNRLVALTHGATPYFLGAIALTAIYSVVALALLQGQDFGATGPLSFTNAPLESALPGSESLSAALDSCFPKAGRSNDYAYKIVGGAVRGQEYYACYEVSRTNGSVFEVRVVDASGTPTGDPMVLKAGGAWPWAGVVKNGQDLTFGGVGVVAVLFFGWLYYRRRRPGEPIGERWYRHHALMFVVALTFVGGLIIAMWPNVSRARKIRVGLEALFAWGGFFVTFPLLLGATKPDPWAQVTGGILVVTLVWSIVAGRRWIAPMDFGAPEAAGPTALPNPIAWQSQAPALPVPPRTKPAAPAPEPVITRPDPGASVPPARLPKPSPASTAPFPIQDPSVLPTFGAVGGMTSLKQELQQTLGLVLAYPDKADEFKITWNGILLHGPPGVGKTFIAKATAGEFGLNFIAVPAAAIASSFRGESPKNVILAFQSAAQNLPCILFFDEFDGIAQRRDDFPDQEARRTVDQLLQSLERFRPLRELVVMAATNDISALDPAVIRPGRFDRHVRVDLPDAEARKAILSVQLKGRPVQDPLDLDDLVRRCEGRSAAAVGQAVEQAALTAFQRASQTGEAAQIRQEDLLAALTTMGGRDRPTVEDWSWDKLILPDAVKAELQELVAVIKNPDAATAYGIDPPSGLLLTGPPGTGKTTIAKVIAAQAQCSFYPVSGADVTSKWVGQSEQNIARLFERARENRPSIIFMDEIDAIASRRGDWGSYDQQINQLLQEIDGMSGQRGVFVMGATNRPDKLDPALLRGGRLSRTIEIPPPTLENRLAMLKLFTTKMPLTGVNLDEVAAKTDGLAGADLKAMCQQAGLVAMVRSTGQADGPEVTSADFERALADIRASGRTNSGTVEAAGVES